MNQPTITQAQADARVTQLIRDTAAALTPPPRLELVPHGTGANDCLHDGEPEGKVVINRAYWLRDIPKSQSMNIGRQVKSYWEAQEHRIVSAGGWQVGHPNIGGVSQPDGYLLALVWTEGDNLYLEATSPCLWPDGTPPARNGR
ncbi:hypothetical protein OIE66_05200 [Nonomuraea sp. NBC_01738]|uniref:hypothetical protein n=1 Tax=Nonomuraea sp. NBC_01738 TaxID=2976003 RepID=UPI002E0F9DD6|nr:hypothetical protein OIE66_05200 [Nonomuraea sp. NBC_01738]